MTKPMFRMLIGVGIFFAIVFGWYGVRAIMFAVYMATYKEPPVTVSATTVTVKNWQSYLTAVGSLTAINGVDLSTEVAGIVRQINFTSGQMVKKGDVLISLDTSIEQASLKANQAKLALADINYKREKTLLAKNVTSEASFDTRNAELLEAQANVESVQAQIRQKTLIAPFDGRIGIRQVDLGQYISPGKTMVTLQSLNPLFVDINLPEQYLPDLYLGQKVEVSVNFGSGKTVFGSITAINSKVDQITRNIMVQATIPNEDFTLYPGMFALSKVWWREAKEMVVVPQTAISYSLSGDYVYVISLDEKDSSDKQKIYIANRQYVKVGERRGDEATIAEGLKAGDKIITSGQLKLQNGTHVILDNSVVL